MNMISAIILFAVIGDFLLHLTADVLNLKRLTGDLPGLFQGYYDARRYATSQDYLRVNTRFKWAASVVDIVLFLGLMFGKGFPLIDGWVRSVSRHPVAGGLLYIGILFLLKWIVSLPFTVYSTFVIEERFGFNKTTWKMFVSDMAKQAVLGIVLGGALVGTVLAFFEYAGPGAWWICWAGIVVFMLIMQLVVPTWIMPLFNKFRPLAPGELKNAIMAYAESIQFSLQNIFVMDGSKRSGKSNAFFTGFGRYKRIVLYDTLIDNHTTKELVAILAHEMGHYKKKHVFWMLAAGMVQTGIMLYLLSLFISSPTLFEAFYMETPSVYAGLVFFGFLYAPVDFFAGILMQFFSRKNEFAADRFAAMTTSDPASFTLALKKLAVHNLSNLTPHPLYVFLNYSHPPILERLKAIAGETVK